MILVIVWFVELEVSLYLYYVNIGLTTKIELISALAQKQTRTHTHASMEKNGLAHFINEQQNSIVIIRVPLIFPFILLSKSTAFAYTNRHAHAHTLFVIRKFSEISNSLGFLPFVFHIAHFPHTTYTLTAHIRPNQIVVITCSTPNEKQFNNIKSNFGLRCICNDHFVCGVRASVCISVCSMFTGYSRLHYKRFFVVVCCFFQI